MLNLYRSSFFLLGLTLFMAFASASCAKDDDNMGVNRPPLLNFSTTALAKAEEPFTFDIDVEDADGDKLTITVNDLPDWLSFDESQQQLNGTPEGSDEGKSTFSIQVSDGTVQREKQVELTVIVPLTFAESINQKIDGLFNQHVPDLTGVSIAVYAPNKGELTTTRGNAKAWESTPLNADHQFRIASVTKTFTAVLLIRMAEEGKLSLDDKLNQYLNIDGLTGGETITLRQMLSNTSGLPDHLNNNDFWDESGDWRNRSWTNQDIIDYAVNKGLRFTPGTAYAYSNTGFYLLGAVAEKVLSQPLGDIFDEWIIEPLDLENTFYDDFSNRQNTIPGLAENARSYEYRLSAVAGAGAMVSTPTDMLKFGRAVYGGSFVTPEHAEDMQTDLAAKLGGDDYGLGTRIWYDNNVHHLGHTGSLMDYRSILMHVPEHDIYISLATQDAHRNWYDLVNGLLVEVVRRYE